MTTPADEIRAAAERLRALVTAATPGPWRGHDTHLGQYGHAATVLSGERDGTELRAWLPSMSQEPWDETRNMWADAPYIATLHPGIGLALATWLETEARVYTEDQAALADDAEFVRALGGEPRTAAEEHGACTAAMCTTEAALALARLINSSQE